MVAFPVGFLPPASLAQPATGGPKRKRLDRSATRPGGSIARDYCAIQKNKTSADRGFVVETGAGNETRTRDPDLGKVVLYQLSYSRVNPPFYGLTDFCQETPPETNPHRSVALLTVAPRSHPRSIAA
jgi:hypothetical protein